MNLLIRLFELMSEVLWWKFFQRFVTSLELFGISVMVEYFSFEHLQEYINSQIKP